MIRPIILVAVVALPFASVAHAQDDILLRQPDGYYTSANPGGAGDYYTKSTDDTYSSVYDKRGDRVGTIKRDALGTRFYGNRGDRR